MGHPQSFPIQTPSIHSGTRPGGQESTPADACRGVNTEAAMTLWRAALVGAGRVAAPRRPARRTAMRADAAPRSGAFQRHKSPIWCSASAPALLCLDAPPPPPPRARSAQRAVRIRTAVWISRVFVLPHGWLCAFGWPQAEGRGGRGRGVVMWCSIAFFEHPASRCPALALHPRQTQQVCSDPACCAGK